MNLTSAAKFTRVLDFTAAGTSDTVTTAIIDMMGFSSVTFVAAIGAMAGSAVAVVKVQQDSAAAMGGAADLLGSGVTLSDADATKLVAIEVVEPRERYVRVAVVRSVANTTIDGIIAIQSMPSTEPVTQSTTVAGTELHASPAEGTA